MTGLELGLRADCASCVGLCCVAPALSASADFAIDKPAGVPCPHLRPDDGCGIHARLRQDGFPGCAAYDCLGAGQKVSQLTFGGRSWREDPTLARQMFAVFTVVRQLHQLLWYLAEALTLPPARALHEELQRACDAIELHSRGAPQALQQLDVAALRAEVDVLLQRASALVRDGRRAGRRALDRAGADLIGAELRGADLRAADLRGAYLIGADLRGADLRDADLIGTDMRAADLRGADLRGCLFLTQPQLDAARGDARTRLPALLRRPVHW